MNMQRIYKIFIGHSPGVVYEHNYPYYINKYILEQKLLLSITRILSSKYDSVFNQTEILVECTNMKNSNQENIIFFLKIIRYSTNDQLLDDLAEYVELDQKIRKLSLDLDQLDLDQFDSIKYSMQKSKIENQIKQLTGDLNVLYLDKIQPLNYK